jgi:hypothetical protein
MHATRLRVVAGAVLALGAALAANAATDGDHGRQERGPASARAPAPARGPGASQGQPRLERQPAPAQRNWRDARGRWFDDRHGHDRYYPPRGAFVPALPDGYRHYRHDGRSYFFHGGVWYEPRGPRFVVVRPPVGLVISVLPSFYTTLWFGGVPYYYADDVYYLWRPDMHGYVVVDPPADEDQAPPASARDDLFIYPKNGQSPDQQAADRYECHAWARGQTGFDPTEDRGGVPAGETGARRSDYLRAMTACLEARGYSVR